MNTTTGTSDWVAQPRAIIALDATSPLQKAATMLRQWISAPRLLAGVLALLVSFAAPAQTAVNQVASKVSAGALFSCAVTSPNGSVYCWGDNTSGNLGDGTRTATSVGTFVAGGFSFAAVSAGYSHACAITATNGGVKCWGDNGLGRLGAGNFNFFSTTPVDVVGLTSGAVAVATGDEHSCALTAAGGVKCWGAGYSGQLGNGDTASSNVPVDVDGLASNAIAISAGSQHSCAVLRGGSVVCWGSNSDGQIGSNAGLLSSTPVSITGLPGPAAMVSAGYRHTCAVMASGAAYCWGSNGSGELGDGTTNPSSTPRQVSGASGVLEIAASRSPSPFSCLRTSTSIACWGDDSAGTLGTGAFTNSSTPQTIHELFGIASSLGQIGGSDTCITTAKGSIRCWGNNGYGGAGNGTNNPSPTPGFATAFAMTRFSMVGPQISVVSSGNLFTCLVAEGGSVWCVGANNSGQLGTGNTTISNTRKLVTGLTSGYTHVVSGAQHSCALSQSGGVKCWGLNAQGQLGNNSTALFSSTPVDVVGLSSGVTQLTAGDQHTCAVHSGVLKCWGSNSNGQLAMVPRGAIRGSR